MPTQDERKEIQSQFDQNKKRGPTTLAEMLRLDEAWESVKEVAGDVIGVLTGIPSTVGGIVSGVVNKIADENREFTSGRFVEEAQKALREQGFESEAVMLGDKLANNPNIAEEKLTIEDLNELGIDMSEGRTELAGEPERETGEPRFVLGQNRTSAFEYDTLGETEEETNRMEQNSKDMYGLDELLNEATGTEETPGKRWSRENADLTGPEDPQVSRIQQGLEQMGFDLGPDGADGYFGENTEQAVTRFQEQYNAASDETIEVDGVVGPETLQAMQRALNEGMRF